MDWLTFISELIKAISWPVTTVVIVILLRRPISSLLLLLRKLKYKDLELEFSHEVQELKDEAEAALPKPDDLVPTESDFTERIFELSKISPTAAVTEAWREVEAASNEMFKSRGLSPTRSHQKRLQLLRSELPFDLFQLAYRLRNLRNQALHLDDAEISRDVAVDVGKVAAQLADYMRKPMDES